MIWILIGRGLKKVFGNRYVQLILVAVALGGGGYAFGRYEQPAKIVTTEKLVTVVQEKIVYQDRVVIKEVKVKDKDTDKHTETTTTKKPDGTVVTTTKTDTHVDEHTDTKKDTTEEKTKVVEKVVEKTVEKTKLVESKKMDWIVHGGLGVSVPVLLGQGTQQGVPGLKGAVIQVGVDRRVVGPFYIGVFGDTQGVAGLRLAGAF